jgi:hypothetical protein
MTETEWMDIVSGWLSESLDRKYPGGRMKASCRKRLPYRFEIRSYNGDDTPNAADPSHYQTDLCIFETHSDGSWTPRVVIEGKLGAVTTHDALTYSAKAATHIQVHPYLRYGILIGALPSVPLRLFRHGSHFDFMITWANEQPNEQESNQFEQIMQEEIEASQLLQKFVEGHRVSEKYQVVRHKLVLR